MSWPSSGNSVETGIVASVARPGGKVTGSSFFYAEINAKRLELIKLALPGLTRVAVLLNPDNSAMASVLSAMKESARSLKLTLWRAQVRALDELDATLARAKAHAQALTVIDGGLFIANARQVADVALRKRVPSIGFREYCEGGGLLAYGVDFPRIWRQSMGLVDRVLKGAKPADLPIQQATNFGLMINLKTARALVWQSRRRCWPVPIRLLNERKDSAASAERMRASNVPLQWTARSRCSRVGP